MSYALETFQNSVRPADELPICDWLNKYVRLVDSAISPRYDVRHTNYFREPLEQIADDDNKEIVVMAPVGAGKSGMIEALVQWIVAEESGGTLLIGQTNDTVKGWKSTRLDPSMKQNERVRPLLPSGRKARNDKKSEILFDHMPMFFTGANETGTQEKSMRWVIGDEVWQWKNGLLDYSRARTHDRHNSRCVYVSQAGLEGDQWDKAWLDSKQHEYHFDCPHCNHSQRYKWEQVRYDEVRLDNEEYNWDEIYKSVHYQCEECEGVIDDTAENRRSMSENGYYVSSGNSHKAGRLGYRFPAMAIWRIEWKTLVEKYLTAKEEEKKGNLEPLKIYQTQRLCIPWTPPKTSLDLTLQGEPYRLEDYWDGQKIDGEHQRFLTIDVQQDHFWAVVRGWRLDSSSKLLYTGKIQTWDGIRQIKDRFDVSNKNVFIDRGYKPDEVGRKCSMCRNDTDRDLFMATLGDDANDGYLKTINGLKFRRSHSDIFNVQTADGHPYRYIKFSNLLMKDMLARYMAGQASTWETPVDLPKSYSEQVQNEHRVEIKPNVHRWEVIKSNRGNHLFDCEVMQILAACLFRIINAKTKVDD